MRSSASAVSKPAAADVVKQSDTPVQTSVRSQFASTAADLAQPDLYVSPLKKNASVGWTPNSKAIAAKPDGKTPVNNAVLVRQVVEAVTAKSKSGFDSHARRKLEFNRQPQQASLAKAESLGELQHLMLAQQKTNLDGLFDSISFVNGRAPIVLVPLIQLSQLSRVDDLTLFKQAMSTMGSSQEVNPSELAGWLSGAGKKTQGKNHLLTVVSINNQVAFRFFSISGLNRSMTPWGKTSTVTVRGNVGGDAVILKGQHLPVSFGQKTAAIVNSADKIIAERGQNKVYLLNYSDIIYHDRAKDKVQELRLLPTMATQSNNGLHDRARDTEYVALTSLIALLGSASALKGQPMDIRMYSTNKMCQSCKGAATYAGLKEVFSGLNSFRIYGGR